MAVRGRTGPLGTPGDTRALASRRAGRRPSSCTAPFHGYDITMTRPATARFYGEAIDPARLVEAVDRLTSSILGDERIRHISTAYLPHRDQIIGIVDRLTWLLFPGFIGPRELSEATMRDHVAAILHESGADLMTQVSAALRYEHDSSGPATKPAPAPAPGTASGARAGAGAAAGIGSRGATSPPPPAATGFDEQCIACDTRAREVVLAFISALPQIRRMLSLDVQAAYDGDPAARHTDEIVFCYPGLRALTIHRLAHELYRLDVPLLPRMMAEHAHAVTGIDIHPGARIGRSFFIDHGTGVVIGETSHIGDHCKIYQGVTLGAKSFPKDERGRLKRGVKRHPTLEDHVTVYAGATILGGDTVIGAGSVINGGVFVTSSVPPGHVVRGPKVEITMRSNPDLPPGNYAI
jgi:serine O-acetyltransferase